MSESMQIYQPENNKINNQVVTPLCSSSGCFPHRESQLDEYSDNTPFASFHLDVLGSAAAVSPLDARSDTGLGTDTQCVVNPMTRPSTVFAQSKTVWVALPDSAMVLVRPDLYSALN